MSLKIKKIKQLEDKIKEKEEKSNKKYKRTRSQTKRTRKQKINQITNNFEKIIKH